MYKQLRDWMIYGQLNDKYDEFYICHDKNVSDATLSTTSTADNQGKTSDEDANYNEIDEIFSSMRFSSSYSQFKLNSSKLPSYINLKIANKILFTGELLQIFQVKYMSENVASKNDTTVNTTLNTTFNKVQYAPEFDKCKHLFTLLLNSSYKLTFTPKSPQFLQKCSKR